MIKLWPDGDGEIFHVSKTTFAKMDPAKVTEINLKKTKKKQFF